MILFIIFLHCTVLYLWIKGDLSEKESGKQTKRWVNGQPRQAEDKTYKNTKDLSRQVKGQKDEVDREKNIRRKIRKQVRGRDI
jgi:hypothetical protein